MKLPTGTISGCFPPIGDLAEADCGLVLEFSHRFEDTHSGQPNIDIARRVEEDPIVRNLPLFVSNSIVRALWEIDSDVVPHDEFEGQSAKGTSENLGTWGELQQGQSFMQEYRFMRPVIITSGYNIGNVVLQAMKLGMNPVVPADLPCSFDWHSGQLWTKNWLFWALLAKPRIHQLRKHAH